MSLLSGLLVLCLALSAAGILYAAIGGWNDRRRFLGMGQLVEIGDGHRLFLSRMGNTGSPAVVFESGVAATSQNWIRLQEAVSRFAPTVSYDRGGLGWSSPAASERTPANIARELHTMLERAGVAPPYLLVGHSFGGLVVRRFAADFPEKTAGVISLDAMQPEEWPPLNLTQVSMLANAKRLTWVAVAICWLGIARVIVTSQLCRGGFFARAFSRATGPGGLHVLDRVTCELAKMPEEIRPIVAAHWSSARFYHGLRAHIAAIPATVRQMHSAPPLPGIPVLLLTAGTAPPLAEEAVRRIGPAARQVILKDSGHWVHLDQHDRVLAEIRAMVAGARSTLLEEISAV
jgi:pimeloyl-ACP methyl ester carboxylesterase